MSTLRAHLGGYAMIALTIGLTVYGQLALKWRLNQLQNGPSDTRHPVLQLLWLLLDPVIMSGLVAAFIASLAWMGVLKKFHLGFAYPFMSLTFAIAIVASAWLFDEPLSWQRIFGVALIMIGTVIAARG